MKMLQVILSNSNSPEIFLKINHTSTLKLQVYNILATDPGFARVFNENFKIGLDGIRIKGMFYFNNDTFIGFVLCKTQCTVGIGFTLILRLSKMYLNLLKGRNFNNHKVLFYTTRSVKQCMVRLMLSNYRSQWTLVISGAFRARCQPYPRSFPIP